MTRIAIFASGSGSNAENIADYFKNDPEVTVALFISNHSNAFVLERAKKLGVESAVFSKADFEKSDDILHFLTKNNINLVVLAGFLLKIPQKMIDAYPNKIINIHPALLPKFGGKGMYGDRVHQAVVAAQEQESGITIHYVNEHYDEGAIIFQARCPVLPTDSPADVASKIHELEYEHFPKVLDNLIRKG
ncbi:MAG: phosphoribosylglycinamide formyltransferase [Flavobacteriales bacterium]|nr:phosphoribosylglycinamide formyltransferase [Flavobacteriales bacterium]